MSTATAETMHDSSSTKPGDPWGLIRMHERDYEAECRAASIDELRSRLGNLKRSLVTPDSNSAVVQKLLSNVKTELKRRKEKEVETQAKCLNPECTRAAPSLNGKPRYRGLCATCYSDKVVRERHGLPSQRPGFPKGRHRKEKVATARPIVLKSPEKPEPAKPVVAGPLVANGAKGGHVHVDLSENRLVLDIRLVAGGQTNGGDDGS